VAALRLRRASAENADDARRAFLEFWHGEGAHHFHVEEDVLLPAFARHVGPDADPIVRTLVEHVDLRRRAADVPEASLEDLHALGRRLGDHIRAEENELFPLIEQALPAAELEALAAAIASRG
jgi:hemerythrin-like domain-containing protein